MNRAAEDSVSSLESRLAALGEALRTHRAHDIEAGAAELQRALASVAEQLRHRKGAGRLPLPLRQRLALASGRVAAQRESLARASAAVDRAIDVLLPAAAPRDAYSAAGIATRQPNSGMLRA